MTTGGRSDGFTHRYQRNWSRVRWAAILPSRLGERPPAGLWRGQSSIARHPPAARRPVRREANASTRCAEAAVGRRRGLWEADHVGDSAAVSYRVAGRRCSQETSGSQTARGSAARLDLAAILRAVVLAGPPGAQEDGAGNHRPLRRRAALLVRHHGRSGNGGNQRRDCDRLRRPAARVGLLAAGRSPGSVATDLPADGHSRVYAAGQFHDRRPRVADGDALSPGRSAVRPAAVLGRNPAAVSVHPRRHRRIRNEGPLFDRGGAADLRRGLAHAAARPAGRLVARLVVASALWRCSTSRACGLAPWWRCCDRT